MQPGLGATVRTSSRAIHAKHAPTHGMHPSEHQSPTYLAACQAARPCICVMTKSYLPPATLRRASRAASASE